MEIITLKDNCYTTEAFPFFFQGIERGYMFPEYYFYPHVQVAFQSMHYQIPVHVR